MDNIVGDSNIDMHSIDGTLVVTSFIAKLWKMVEDPKTNDTICWSKSGRSFLIFKEATFWYALLPQYYKHSNMSSFIRQLNMYGFHKKSKIMKSDSNSEEPDYEFVHPFFQRGMPKLLNNIKRKPSGFKISVTTPTESDQLNNVIGDIKSLNSRQAKTDSVVNNLKQENAVLWQEVVMLQQKQQKYQQILNKLIHFLVTIVQPSTRFGGGTSLKKHSLMIQDNPSKKFKSSNDGPTIQEIENIDVIPEPSQPDVNAVCDLTLQNPSTSEGIQGDLCFPFDEVAAETNNVLDGLSATPMNELDLPDELLSFPTFDISNVLEDGNGSLNLENIKALFLNSNIQDPLLTSILSDTYNNEMAKYELSNNEETAEYNGEPNMSVATCRSNSPFSWLNTLGLLENESEDTQTKED